MEPVLRACTGYAVSFRERIKPGSHSAASVQRVGACGGGAGVHARSTDCGLSVAARHAGRNSGARVSRTRRQPLADALHGLLHAHARADCAHWPERNGDGRMPARRKSADGADLFAGACVDGVLCQSCAWNGFSIPVCAADRNAACVDRQCGIRRVYRLLTGDDDAAVSGDGRRGAAALRREVSTRRFFCYTKIKKCCIIKQNIGHIA